MISTTSITNDRRYGNDLQPCDIFALHHDELVHALFLLEDRFGIEPCADGSIRFTDEAIQSCVCTWRDWKEFLEKGKITREEYEDRKDGSMR